MARFADAAVESPAAADYYYNLGNIAIAKEDYQKAVDAYKQSLLRNPGDLQAKENYIYAKKKLQEQQNQDQKEQENKQDEQEQQQEQPQNFSEQEQEAMLEAIQAQEDKTQDKLKEKKGVLIRGGKNW